MKWNALWMCAVLTSANAVEPLVIVESPSIADLQRKMGNGGDAFAKLERPSEEQASAQRTAPPSILAQSEILEFGGHWTLVPRGALLHVPEAHLPRVGKRPLGVLLQFQDFLAVNRSWISTEEVDYQTASGERKISTDKLAFWEKQDRVIIAVHQGGPISVSKP